MSKMFNGKTLEEFREDERKATAQILSCIRQMSDVMTYVLEQMEQHRTDTEQENQK